jgi:hypothetical protein
MGYVDIQGLADCNVVCYGKLSKLVKVLSVEATQHGVLRVTFDRGLKDNAALVMPYNYIPTVLTPGAAPIVVNVVLPEANTARPAYVDLEVSEMTQGASYSCAVSPNGPVDSDDTPIDPDNNASTFVGIGEYPTIKHLISQSANRVDIVFSEAIVDNTYARDALNYTFDGGLNVLNVLDVIDDTVKLVTSNQAPGALYTLTINTGSPPPPITLDWSQIFPATTHNADLYGIAYGAGVWIGVGDAGLGCAYLIRSEDGGETWDEITNPRNTPLGSVAYGDKVWIAVGGNDHVAPSADAYIIRSLDDGLTWTEMDNPSARGIYAVAFGDGVWIGVGDNNGGSDNAYIVRSIDGGFTWTEIETTKHLSLMGVGYHDGTWIAVGDNDGDAYILRSVDDGLTWTEIENPVDIYLYSVIYGGGVWIAVGGASVTYPCILRSTDDGLTWTESAETTLLWDLESIAYGAGTWLAVGGTDGIMDAGSAISTNNGLNFYEVVNPQIIGLHEVSYGNGAFIAVGGTDGANAYMMATEIIPPPVPTPITPLEWTAQDSKIASALYRLKYYDGLWITAGSSGQISTSPDGQVWTLNPTSLGISFIYRVTVGDAQWAVSGNGARFSTSRNGQNWYTFTTPFDFYDVAYGAGVWVGISSGGQVATSQNGGNTWAIRRIGQTATLREVIFLDDPLEGQRWILTGDSGAVSMSYDGLDWAICNSQFGSSDIDHTIHANHIWVMVGADGKLSTSTNSVTWTARDSQFGSSHIFYVAFGDGVWVIVGAGGKLATSYDGINWTLRDSGTTVDLVRVAYHGNGEFAVGGTGIIITSPNYGTSWIENVDTFGASGVYGIEYGDSGWVAIGDAGKLSTSP